MNNTRRKFLQSTGLVATLASMGVGSSILSACSGTKSRNDHLNILCWEGYNSERVLGPFRAKNLGAKVRAESGTNDPDMINKLRAGETNVWDLINVNQPWARAQLFPSNLIKTLDKDRFLKYYDLMMDEFKGPYPYAFDQSGKELIGMVQRFGPFSFVVNTDKVSRKTAEDQGFKLFLDPKMKGKYAILTYDDWNIIHLALAADLDPSKEFSEDDFKKFKLVSDQIFKNAKLLSDDMTKLNQALVNNEISAYFTGGTYTASPARIEGHKQIRAITPAKGPVDGKGGVVWVEVTSLVNNPNPSTLAADFLEYVQQPEISKVVAFAEGTHNPVAQMGNPEVLKQFLPDELDALQWDSLKEEMARSIDYPIVPSHDKLIEIITAAKRTG
ncbi:MAG: PotD/PotF family extracellular solute-binding protein [Methylacidiphilales bacterium]|nr:PotD/PotF family extracellular solute-binding protein [Candidatus Methylacidiphilales bacterium]